MAEDNAPIAADDELESLLEAKPSRSSFVPEVR